MLDIGAHIGITALPISSVLAPGGRVHAFEASTTNLKMLRFHIRKNSVANIDVVPRLVGDEIVKVANDITSRLEYTKGNAVFMLPKDGTGTYGRPGGVLRDIESDALFFDTLRASLPGTIELIERDTHAEDPEFVRECVDRLIGLMEKA